MRGTKLFPVIVFALVFSFCGSLRAQKEVSLLSPNPITEPLNKLVANFESQTGIHVNVTYGTGVGTRQTVAAAKLWTYRFCSRLFPRRLRPATSFRAARRWSPDCAWR